MLKKISLFLILIFWPLSFFLANTRADFIHHIIPASLIALGIFISEVFILPIGIIEPKLSLLHLIYFFLFFLKATTRLNLVLLTVSLLIFGVNFREFKAQSNLNITHEEQQLLIREQQLYPTILTARIFQNKARVVQEKVFSNFFVLTDPSNYFFAFHPREVNVDNQNLKKFPMLALPLVLTGFYFSKNIKIKKYLISIFVASIVNLSLLNRFDRHDIVLWIPIFLVVWHGIKQFEKKGWFPIFMLFFVAVSCWELLRVVYA